MWGIPTGWGLVAQVVRYFTQRRIKEKFIEYSTRDGGAQKSKGETVCRAGGEGSQLQGGVGEYGAVGNFPFLGNCRNCAWM